MDRRSPHSHAGVRLPRHPRILLYFVTTLATITLAVILLFDSLLRTRVVAHVTALLSYNTCFNNASSLAHHRSHHSYDCSNPSFPCLDRTADCFDTPAYLHQRSPTHCSILLDPIAHKNSLHFSFLSLSSLSLISWHSRHHSHGLPLPLIFFITFSLSLSLITRKLSHDAFYTRQMQNLIYKTPFCQWERQCQFLSTMLE